jgi:hypothetical protein
MKETVAAINLTIMSHDISYTKGNGSTDCPADGLLALLQYGDLSIHCGDGLVKVTGDEEACVNCMLMQPC